MLVLSRKGVKKYPNMMPIHIMEVRQMVFITGRDKEDRWI
jgi:hypothetical protein